MSTLKSSADDLTLNADGSGNDVIIQSNGSTKAIVTAEGTVGIGCTPSSELHIKTSVDDSLSQGLVIERSANSDRGYINYQGGGFQLRSTDGDPIVFGQVSNERMRILAAGGLTFNGDTAAANALDDYEEGSFTPVYALATPGDSSWTHDRQYGRYTKIGRQVFFQMYLRSDAYSNTTGSGNVHVTGLPFATESTSYTFRSVCIYAASFAADNNPRTATLGNDVSYIVLKKRADVNNNDTDLDENSFANGTNMNALYAFGSYYV